MYEAKEKVQIAQRLQGTRSFGSIIAEPDHTWCAQGRASVRPLRVCAHTGPRIARLPLPLSPQLQGRLRLMLSARLLLHSRWRSPVSNPTPVRPLHPTAGGRAAAQ